MAPRGPKIPAYLTSDRSVSGPKMAPIWHQEAPRWPQEAPGWVQEGSFEAILMPDTNRPEVEERFSKQVPPTMALGARRARGLIFQDKKPKHQPTRDLKCLGP